MRRRQRSWKRALAGDDGYATVVTAGTSGAATSAARCATTAVCTTSCSAATATTAASATAVAAAAAVPSHSATITLCAGRRPSPAAAGAAKLEHSGVRQIGRAHV